MSRDNNLKIENFFENDNKMSKYEINVNFYKNSIVLWIKI